MQRSNEHFLPGTCRHRLLRKAMAVEGAKKKVIRVEKDSGHSANASNSSMLSFLGSQVRESECIKSAEYA